MKDLLAFDVRTREWPMPKLIDVTLRDGGFRNSFSWSIDEIIKIATAALNAGAYCAELGYIGGVPELHNVRDVGPAASLTVKDVEQVRKRIDKGLLCAMVHPSVAVSNQPFEALQQAGLNMVRLVYHESWDDRFVSLAEAAASAGLTTSANLALASRYDLPGLIEKARHLCQHVDIIYLADTCSAMLPAEVEALTQELIKMCPVGFHGHDFLSLALANALIATSAGATWIDASICGIGRGAGNLRLELWLVLQASCKADSAKLRPLVYAMQMIEDRLGPQTIPDLGSIISGALNLTPPQEDQLRTFAHLETLPIGDASVALLDSRLNAESVTEVLEKFFAQL
ncbi:MAG: hypothetical protein F6J86_10545 [Symploca sp. SIO1B1]|nr:hypothetical protein [Symploca sp. SIO1B1]